MTTRIKLLRVVVLTAAVSILSFVLSAVPPHTGRVASAAPASCQSAGGCSASTAASPKASQPTVGPCAGGSCAKPSPKPALSTPVPVGKVGLPAGTKVCSSPPGKQSSTGTCDPVPPPPGGWPTHHPAKSRVDATPNDYTTGYYVAMLTNMNAVAPGQYSTVSASSYGTDVGPTPYFLQVFDHGTGRLIAQCGTGSFCSASVSMSAPITEFYTAYIAGYCNSSCTEPPPNIQASISPNFVTWLQASISGANNLGVGANPTYSGVNRTVTITGSTNALNRQTSIGLSILDLTSGVTYSCETGSQLGVNTCVIDDSYDYPTTHTYQARARNPADSNTIALTQVFSPTFQITWVVVNIADYHSVVGVGTTVSLTADSSADVGPTPYYIFIVDTTTGTLLKGCGSGSSCSVAVSNDTLGQHVYQAFIALTAPPPSGIVSSSYTVTTTWMDPTLDAFPYKNTSTADLPDPAGVEVAAGNTQIYASGTGSPAGNGAFLATESWAEGTAPFSAVSNALSATDPQAVTFGLERGWAPTVQKIGNQYVLWFSGFHGSTGKSNCLYVATNTAANTEFHILNHEYCAPPGSGMFDPSLWIAPNGAPSLVYAGEPNAPTGSATNKNEANLIYTVALTPDGTDFASGAPPINLASWSGMPSGIASPGDRAVIENPAFQTEPHPYIDQYGHQVLIDMFLSYGTYNEPNSYHTVEVPCVSVSGPCDTGLAYLVDRSLQGPSPPPILQNTGGASLTEGSPNGEAYLFFAAVGSTDNPTASRAMYVQQVRH